MVKSEQESEGFLHIVAADVRLRNLCFDRMPDMGEGVISVAEGGRLWLEHCSMNFIDGALSIKPTASAFIRDTRLCGGSRSAIEIDPQAHTVLVERCHISGSGAGNDYYSPAEFGAIEITGYNQSVHTMKSRETNHATARVALRSNTIDNNYGHAFSYRTDISASARRFLRSTFHFEFDRALRLLISSNGNDISGNCLGMDSQSDSEGDAIIHNCRAHRHNR
eukprot:TRINITY_DN30457_c0_g1_i2.p1 TRINITY_DN30457_c0_g1~~TRINITY_DN30457_c0_g1_i2.p1  ORF type:complete len:222 (+),score=20.66 TRINITY_DN30457_c0_g1_i2:189-854(+)